VAETGRKHGGIFSIATVVPLEQPWSSAAGRRRIQCGNEKPNTKQSKVVGDEQKIKYEKPHASERHGRSVNELMFQSLVVALSAYLSAYLSVQLPVHVYVQLVVYLNGHLHAGSAVRSFVQPWFEPQAGIMPRRLTGKRVCRRAGRRTAGRQRRSSHYNEYGAIHNRSDVGWRTKIESNWKSTNRAKFSFLFIYTTTTRTTRIPINKFLLVTTRRSTR